MAIPKDKNLKEIQDILDGKGRTNYERIRNMNVSELAEFINKYCFGLVDEICLAVCPQQDCEKDDTAQYVCCIKEWLEKGSE